MNISEFQPSSGRYLDENSEERNIIDTTTGAPKIITSDHSKIHEGEGFSISGIFTGVANAAVVNYAFKTPTVASGKYIHWKYRDLQATSSKVRVDFYEAPTNAPINGTNLAAYNRNRISATVTAMQAIKTGMDLDLTGATMLNSAQFLSGEARSLDIEYVLKQNTWYILTITNGTGGAADINFFEFWYEEDAG